MLETLLGLLGDNVNAVAAEFCLDECRQTVLDYCHIDELPTELEGMVIRMAIDLYRIEGYGKKDPPKGPVTTVKEGDQSVSYATDRTTAIAGNKAAAELLKDYKARLDSKYRKLGW